MGIGTEKEGRKDREDTEKGGEREREDKVSKVPFCCHDTRGGLAAEWLAMFPTWKAQYGA